MSPSSFPWNITQPFSWLDAEDPSQPVVYTFEIAAERKFRGLLLRKTGLFKTQYILTDNETLKAGFAPVTYFWRVMATDAAGNEGQWSEVQPFSVSAPPAPTLLEPAPGTKPESPFRFTWQPVSNSVTAGALYLQVAAEEDFRSPALEKTGLAATEYILPEESPLLRGGTLYYWRVRATDGAGNSSDWSKAASFHGRLCFPVPGLGGLLPHRHRRRRRHLPGLLPGQKPRRAPAGATIRPRRRYIKWGACYACNKILIIF